MKVILTPLHLSSSASPYFSHHTSHTSLFPTSSSLSLFPPLSLLPPFSFPPPSPSSLPLPPFLPPSSSPPPPSSFPPPSLPPSSFPLPSCSLPPPSLPLFYCISLPLSSLPLLFSLPPLLSPSFLVTLPSPSLSLTSSHLTFSYLILPLRTSPYFSFARLLLDFPYFIYKNKPLFHRLLKTDQFLAQLSRYIIVLVVTFLILNSILTVFLLCYVVWSYVRGNVCQFGNASSG